MKQINRDRKLRRKRRVSNNIFGTNARPRIVVFKSNKYIYAQAIDDEKRATIASFSSLKLSKVNNYQKQKKLIEAMSTGRELASVLKKLDIKEAVFDRSVYKYTGRVKALCEGLREEGIKI